MKFISLPCIQKWGHFREYQSGIIGVGEWKGEDALNNIVTINADKIVEIQSCGGNVTRLFLAHDFIYVIALSKEKVLQELNKE